MSGVMIKAGIYGLVRVTGFFAVVPPWWGWVILPPAPFLESWGWPSPSPSTTSSACSPTTAWRTSASSPSGSDGPARTLLSSARCWRFWALCGALLHVINHGLFKSLLFFGRRLHHPRHRHPGDRPLRRPAAGAALDRPFFPRRRGGDQRPAPAERVRQRVVHLPRAAPIGRKPSLALRLVGLRRAGSGADRGLGPGLLRQGLRRRFLGFCPIRGIGHGPRGPVTMSGRWAILLAALPADRSVPRPGGPPALAGRSRVGRQAWPFRGEFHHAGSGGAITGAALLLLVLLAAVGFWLVRKSRRECLDRSHLGLWLFLSDSSHAVHRLLLRRDARRPLRLGAAFRAARR